MDLMEYKNKVRHRRHRISANLKLKSSIELDILSYFSREFLIYANIIFLEMKNVLSVFNVFLSTMKKAIVELMELRENKNRLNIA